jgi:hypothetical protein
MKYYLNTYLDLLLINLLTLIIGLSAYNIVSEHKVEILGAILATGISLSIGFRQLKVENDKIFKELFKEFNKRYQENFHIKFVEIEIDCGSSNDELYYKKVEPELINAYMNLCAEEYLWYQKGRIPKSVWDAWEVGMLHYFNSKAFNFWVLNQKSDKDSHYGLFDEIGNKIIGWKEIV